MLSDIDLSSRNVDYPVRQLEDGRTVGDENHGPVVERVVAVFNE